MDNTRAKLPPVLDATCGGRMMWFNKRHPLALYLDNREIADVELCDGRHFSVRPDIVADFTALPFPEWQLPAGSLRPATPGESWGRRLTQRSSTVVWIQTGGQRCELDSGSA